VFLFYVCATNVKQKHKQKIGLHVSKYLDQLWYVSTKSITQFNK